MDYREGYIFSENSDQISSIENIKNLMHVSEIDIQKKLMDLNKRGWIEFRKNNLVHIRRISPKKWALAMARVDEIPVYKEKDRLAIMFLLCYGETEMISVYLFQSVLLVSKGTVISDIKRLREILNLNNLTLEYSRKDGFFIEGREQKIRQVAHDFIVQLMEKSSGRYALFYWLALSDLSLYTRVRDTVAAAIKSIGLSVVDGRIDEAIIFIAGSIQRIGNKQIRNFETSALVRELDAFRAGEEIVKDITSNNIKQEFLEFENEYITEVILTSIKGEPKDESLDIFLKYSADIIQHMEALTAINFSEYKNVLINLFYHLVPAYFRIDLGFKVYNGMTKDIKKQYGDIFMMTKLSLRSFEKIMNKTIPDEELSYFTVLFGGAIYKEKSQKRNIKPNALILCPDGTSSAILLKTELKEMFPTIDFRVTESINEFDEIVAQMPYDVIFTTVPIDGNEKNIIDVTPIMSQLEKNRIIIEVQNRILLPGTRVLSAKEIMNVLMPYIQLRKGVDEEDIYKIINRKINKNIILEEDDRPMLKDLLSLEMIQVTENKLNWQEAISVAAKPLLNSTSIEPRYIDAMIDKVEQYGPFINIGKGIALPHARPEEGANKIGISVLKVKHPVLLLDEESHPISLFICLSAVDSSTHLHALGELTDILSDKDKLNKLLEADTKEEIFSILTK